jgi:hypothetical protein
MVSRQRTADEAADAAMEQIRKGADEPASPTLPEETKFNFRSSGFSRMRTEWRREDHEVIQAALDAVEERIVKVLFPDAYQVMFELYSIVRTPQTQNGEVVVDRFGLPLWKRLPSGAWEEDYSKLTTRQKEDFLFRITTNIFAWSQRAADLWGEAMFAKVHWEEHHAFAYISEYKGKDTVEGRTAYANQESIDERYFAVFRSLLSRRADAIVRSLELLSQRLKDSLTM